MKRYDYEEALKSDLRDWLKEFINIKGWSKSDCESDRNKTDAYDTAFIEDSVTGNASGSYTRFSWEAEENICHNLDLLGEAVNEFGDGFDVLEKGAEACDVTIRCYILGQVFDEVWEEVVDEMPEDGEVEEAE